LLKFYNNYKKFIAGMNKVLDVITVALMLSMVGVVSYQVFMRQFFNRPPIWGEEVSITLMIWFVFLGIVLGLEEDLHIGITMLVSKLPPKLRYGLEVFVHGLILVLAVLFVYYGYNLTSRILSFGTVLTATRWPAAIHYFAVPVAGAMMALVTLGKIAGAFIIKDNKDTNGEEQST